MPQLQSDYFGTIHYRPESVIEFPRGLPGFDDQRSFVLVEQEINRPAVFLQSLTRPDLCFLTLPASAVAPGYRLYLSDEERAVLGLEQPEPPAGHAALLTLVIVSLAEGRPPTANLLSPVVIHCGRRVGVQSIPSESPYSHQHPLEAEPAAAPCS
jgi:flagellar assembly factor FliW